MTTLVHDEVTTKQVYTWSLTAVPGYADLRTSKSHLRHRKSDRRLLVLYLTVLIVQNCEFYCVNFRCTHAHFDQSIPSHSPPSASFFFFNNNPPSVFMISSGPSRFLLSLEYFCVGNPSWNNTDKIRTVFSQQRA